MAGMAEVARATVTIIPNMRGAQQTIARDLTGIGNAAGGKAGIGFASRMKSAILAAGIGTAVTAGLKKSLSEGASLEQSYLGGLDTLYGNAADKAREYADAAYKAGISQNSFAEQAVSFGASLKQAYGGDATQALEAANTAIMDMADNAAKMGTPLQSIQDAYQGFAKQNYTMLDNLKLGYGGTKTEMERLLADAEKISGVKYDISNLGDVYSAIHVIQGELGLTGVAADEAANTFSGSLGAMKAAFDNLMGNMMLGQNVGPAMKNLAETASTFLFDNLIPAIGRIFQSLPVAIGTFIQSGLPQFMKAGTQMMQSLIEGAKTALPGMISNLFTSLADMSASFGSAASGFIDMGLTLAKSIANGIIKNIPTIIQTVPQIITNLANIINNNAPKIIATGAVILKNLAVGLIRAIPVLIQNIPKILKAAVAVFEAFQWANVGKLVVSGIAKGLKAGIGVVKSSGKKIGTSIVNAIKSVPSKIKGFVNKIKSHLMFAGLASKVRSNFDKIKEKMTQPIQKAKDKIKGFVDKIKGFFPISIGKWLSNLPSLSLKTATKTILGKTITYPVGFSWNAKAMQQPYMFTGATLFGAGEAGDEMLYGRKALMRDIREANAGISGPVYNIGDITLSVKDMEDLMTLEDFVKIAMRAKRFK